MNNTPPAIAQAIHLSINEDIPLSLLKDPLYRNNVRETLKECNPAVNRSYIKLVFAQYTAIDEIQLWMISLLADYCERVQRIDFSPSSLDYIKLSVVPPDDSTPLNVWRRQMLAILL